LLEFVIKDISQEGGEEAKEKDNTEDTEEANRGTEKKGKSITQRAIEGRRGREEKD